MRMLDRLHPAPLSQSEIDNATVVEVSTNVVCSPVRRPVFSLDGSIAVPGREPQYQRTDYLVRLQPARGRALWISVDPLVQRSAKIGQPFKGN